MVTARWRGHPIEYTGEAWLYQDTRCLVSCDPERSCGHCGEPNSPEGHDPCIARLHPASSTPAAATGTRARRT